MLVALIEDSKYFQIDLSVRAKMGEFASDGTAFVFSFQTIFSLHRLHDD